MIKIKVLKKHPDAKMPFRKRDTDFGFDLYATSVEEVAPFVFKYGTGLAFQAVREDGSVVDNELVGITFRPRSSVWKTGMVLSNSIGTIDEEYTGEVSAVFYHIMPSMPKYKVGDRIGQIHFDVAKQVEFVEVDALDETDRGDKAYGSTGK